MLFRPTVIMLSTEDSNRNIQRGILLDDLTILDNTYLLLQYVVLAASYPYLYLLSTEDSNSNCCLLKSEDSKSNIMLIIIMKTANRPVLTK